MPPPGAFLMPIGPLRYGYCLQVERIAQDPQDYEPGTVHGTFTRWGLDRATRQPLDDGHVNKGHIHVGSFRPIGRNAWRISDEGSTWWGEPVYLREIQQQPPAQGALF